MSQLIFGEIVDKAKARGELLKIKKQLKEALIYADSRIHRWLAQIDKYYANRPLRSSLGWYPNRLYYKLSFWRMEKNLLTTELQEVNAALAILNNKLVVTFYISSRLCEIIEKYEKSVEIEHDKI